jgi:hypothetical protein
MVIYEVNLSVELGVAEAYKQWLRGHIEAMLAFKGFVKAETFTVEIDEGQGNGRIELVVQYHIESRDDLEHYFQHHAGAMRAEGKQKFGDAFSATRRVLHSVS